jgi:DNA primase catalytic subunit
MGCAGQVAFMGRRGIHADVRCENRKEREYCEDLDEGGRIIFGWFLEL